MNKPHYLEQDTGLTPHTPPHLHYFYCQRLKQFIVEKAIKEQLLISF